MADVLTGADLATFTGGEVGAGAQAGDAVRAVLRAVRTYCGWHVLGEREDTLTLNGSGTQTLELPTVHVVDVLAVTEDDEPLPATAYRWSEDGAIRKRVGCWSNEFRSVTVTLRHGYDDADDVRGVVLAAAARAVTNPLAFSNQAVGAMSFGHGAIGGFMESEYVTLDLYRAVV